MNANQNRFSAGVLLFFAGFVWNVYYSVLSLEPARPTYGTYLQAGGMVIAIGLLIMVRNWRGR